MKLRDVIIAGVKPLAQNRLRAGLSILGISIGIAGVLCMIAIGDGAKRILAEDIEKLGGANQLTLWTRMSTFKGGRQQVKLTAKRTPFSNACQFGRDSLWITSISNVNIGINIAIYSILGWILYQI